MNTILYRPINYAAEEDCRQIDRLYKDIFHLDFSVKSNIWCQPQRTPLGILAINAASGEAVGHFSSSLFCAKIENSPMPFRISMGFMTDPAYRGQGIATKLYLHLRDAILAAQDAQFLIGFPNDTSYRMHVDRMEYSLYRDYHFVVLPRGPHRYTYKSYNGDFSEGRHGMTSPNNRVEHSASYMNWRYQNPDYNRWQSETGHLFITVRFQNKIDILYWSEGALLEELLDFASFLYETESVEKVTTWNSLDALNAYPKEARAYHMCINYLTCSAAEKQAIQHKWLFWMGDCELF